MTLLERNQWGARPPRSVSTIPTPSRRLILHHGATPGEGPSRVRSYQRYHMDARGYVDIGYSWLADSLYCYVGRGAGVQGAHTRGHNEDHAVCAVGDYSAIDPPEGLLDNLAWLAVHAWHIGAVDRPEYDGGHRDYGTTSCPGDRLYDQLHEINRRAAELARPNEVPVDAVILLHPSEGTPDAIAGLAALFARPDQKVGLVVNVASARQALREGKRVYAVGGPAAKLVAGDKDLVGAARLDTQAKVLEQSRKGW